MAKIKIIAMLLWLVVVSAAIYFFANTELEINEIPTLLDNSLSQFGFFQAALLYIVLYTFRALTFFPATPLTIAAGVMFGPVWGIGVAIIAENLSAAFSFYLARLFGRDWVAAKETDFIKDWEIKLNQNGLLTVLILRIIMLPFDLVGYGCGLTSVKFWDYIVGSAIGIMPALISLVLLGASVTANNDNRLLTLGLAIFFLVLGYLIAYVFKRRSGQLG